MRYTLWIPVTKYTKVIQSTAEKRCKFLSSFLLAPKKEKVLNVRTIVRTNMTLLHDDQRPLVFRLYHRPQSWNIIDLVASVHPSVCLCVRGSALPSAAKRNRSHWSSKYRVVVLSLSVIRETLLPLICTCTFYTHIRYHPNLRKCHGLPWT